MNKKKNVHVIVATGEWGQDHLRYRRHRLAEYLFGHPDTDEVIWVCPSVSGARESFTTLENGIKQFTIQDLHPNKLFRFGRYFDLFYKSKLHALKNHLSQKKETNHLCLWFTFPGFPYMTELVQWDRTSYDCSDLWASSISGSKNVIMMLREKSILQSEERIAEGVETIFSTSDYLHDNLKEQYGIKKPVHVLENGVEYSLFQTEEMPAGLKITGDVVLGFIGGLKPKLDFALLYDVMQQKKNWHLLLVGPDGTNDDSDFKKLLECDNVTWTGKIPPMEVPHYMNALDVGILPYKDSIYNYAVFPLKLFEFLGAGKPVVGMNLPSTKKFSEENIYEYAEKDDTATFLSLCEKVSAVPGLQDVIARRKALAQEKDWKNIFDNMYQIAIPK